MPDSETRRVAAVTLAFFLLAAGCTPSGHPPGTGGQALHQLRPPSIWRQLSPPIAASTPRYRVTPTMSIETSPPPRRHSGNPHVSRGRDRVLQRRGLAHPGLAYTNSAPLRPLRPPRAAGPAPPAR